MSPNALLRRSLTYFARAHVAVVAGVIVATATMAGALIVGDSVRGSLRDMTLERLGAIQGVLTGPRFVTENTVAGYPDEAVPSILLTGTLKANDRVAGSVQLVGIPPDAGESLWPREPLGLKDDGIVINRRVADELGVQSDDTVSLLVELPASVPRDSLLGERDEVLVEVVLPVTRVLAEDSGPGRFSLSPAQQIPSVAFLGLENLQDALDLSAVRATRRTAGRLGRVNTVLLPLGDDSDRSVSFAADATETFDDLWTLEDLDLRLVEGPDGITSVESRAQILSDGLAEEIFEAAATNGDASADGILVYLVNEIANAANADRFSTYSVLAGVDSFDGFEFNAADPPASLGSNDIVINEWLAEDLGVDVDDEITLTYLQVGDTGDLPELTESFRVAGIVAMAGPAIDRTLTPTVPGITDADSFDSWDQPYTMDLNRVTDRDEDYWDLYRATPKLFVSLETMQRLFASRYGKLTSIRVATDDREALTAAILKAVGPAETGLIVRDVRAEQLAAASGTTDFSGLFFGFSLFLIASAILLIGLLFRLGVEQRVTQFGLLRAVGWETSRVRRLLLSEGLALAFVGSVLGLVAAVAYAGAMLYGLTTWWGGATGTQFLTLHVTPMSLVVGFLIAVIVSLATMWLSIRQLNREQPRNLLAGQLSSASHVRSTRSRTIAIATLSIAGALLLGLLAGVIPNIEAFAGFSYRVVGFFLVGMLGLVGGLAAFATSLGPRETSASLGLSRLGWRNVARSRGRSLLTASLIGSACFLLVAVGVARKDPSAIEPDRASGNGGYRLVGETAVPILTDISKAEGRQDAQFLADKDDELFAAMSITSLRMRPGDDASCLNLYSARLPTLLGIPEETLRRWDEEDRFRFADTPSETPWLTLLDDVPDGSTLQIPVLGDMNTLLYSLHKGIGQNVEVPDEIHPDASLSVRGMLDGSVFQGMLLMSDTNLRRLDPAVVGYRYLLVEADEAAAPTTLLETGLADYGLDLEPVAVRIADFLAVQNTYLTTFQTLGGLGLLLGTLGLGAVMLRNVVERQGELALMRAVGFQRGRLGKLILGESTLLLLVGLGVGATTALLAMLPHIISSGADVPWASLGVLLVSVLVAGLLAAGWAVRKATSVPLLGALKGE